MEQALQFCPSCRGPVPGVYCPACGERISTDKKELSFHFFMKDAFEEIFNLDSKFARTLKVLVTKPGFLTMELLAGRKIQYIKPVKLYTIIVVVHFVIFSFAGSGDLFSTTRFPGARIVPDLQQSMLPYELSSGLSHEKFSEVLNRNIKDDLNIIFYFLPFLLASYFKLLYRRSGKYYVEHLYFVLHLITFGLIRNVVIVPFLMMDWVVIAFAISILTQLWYTFVSVSKVYGEGPEKTILKVILVMVGFVLILLPGWFLALFIGIGQIVAW